MDCTVTIRNAGEYVARFKYPFIWIRGPAGQNLDSQSGLGGPEQGVTRPHPDEQRTINRRSLQFGIEPGNYVVGVSYLSEQDHSRNIVTGPPGTTSTQQVTLQSAQLAGEGKFAEGALKARLAVETLRGFDPPPEMKVGYLRLFADGLILAGQRRRIRSCSWRRRCNLSGRR